MARKRKLRKAGLLNKKAEATETEAPAVVEPAPAPVVEVVEEPVAAEPEPKKKGLFGQEKPMKFNLDSLTKRFILNEGQGPTMSSWIQALTENINALRPRSMAEERRIEVMKHQMRELRRTSRKMQESINQLEEQVNILQEEKRDE